MREPASYINPELSFGRNVLRVLTLFALFVAYAFTAPLAWKFLTGQPMDAFLWLGWLVFGYFKGISYFLQFLKRIPGVAPVIRWGMGIS
ncbi:MAG: hypothetical protein ACFFD4_38970 [Candidatus Odinarchaeota archaeon]